MVHEGDGGKAEDVGATFYRAESETDMGDANKYSVLKILLTRPHLANACASSLHI